jgi:hypothetical protein
LDKLAQPPQRGRKRYRSQAELIEVTDQLLHKYKMTGVVNVTYKSQPHSDGGERWQVADYQCDAAAWEKMVSRLGWQVYLIGDYPYLLNQ